MRTRKALEVTVLLAGGLALAGAMAAAAAQYPERSKEQEPKLSDATIVAIFDYANTRDIETAELALERAESERVKEFARTLIRDHTQVRKQGRELAEKLGVTPTPPQEDEAKQQHARAMETLRAASGAAFDRAWLEYEIDYHSSVIQALNENLLAAIENQELKAFVESVAPAFQAHLRAARDLKTRVVSSS